MQNLLVAIGTPTRVCKPRGIAPGWSIGRVRKQRERFDLIYSKRWRIVRAHQQPKIPGQKPKRGRPKKIKPVLFLLDPEFIHDLMVSIGELLGKIFIKNYFDWKLNYNSNKL